MNLKHLAPDIQEAILFLPRVERGEDPPEARIHRLADALDADEHKKSPTVWAGLESFEVRLLLSRSLVLTSSSNTDKPHADAADAEESEGGGFGDSTA